MCEVWVRPGCFLPSQRSECCSSLSPTDLLLEDAFSNRLLFVAVLHLCSPLMGCITVWICFLLSFLLHGIISFQGGGLCLPVSHIHPARLVHQPRFMVCVYFLKMNLQIHCLHFSGLKDLSGWEIQTTSRCQAEFGICLANDTVC